MKTHPLMLRLVQSFQPRSFCHIESRGHHFIAASLILLGLLLGSGLQTPSLSAQASVDIKVTKVIDLNGVNGVPSATDFTVCLNGPSTQCKIVAAGQEVTYENMTYGTYTITEPGLPPEWIMQPVSPFLGTTTFPPSLSQTVTNVYNPGALKVTKIVNGGPTDQEFTICITGPSYPGGSCKSFTSTSSSSAKTWGKLLVGEYTVTEVNPGSQWIVSGSGEKVTVTAGNTAQATITNSLRGTLGITKQVFPADLPDSVNTQFEICINGPSHAPEAPKCAVLSNDGFKLFEDLTPGQYAITENPGSAWTVSFEPGNTVEVDGSAVNVIVKNTLKPASLKLTQSVDDSSVVAGSTVVYTFFVENTGEVALTDIGVTDSECTPSSVTSGGFNVGDTNVNNQLDGGDAPWQFTCSEQILADTTNTASASGVSPAGLMVTSNNSSTTVDVRPSVKLTKAVEPVSRPEPGGVFLYTLTIGNTSAEPVEIVALTDTHELSPACEELVNQQLPIGGSATCSYELTFSQVGAHPNSATVEVLGTNNVRSNSIDSVTVNVVDLASNLEVTKTASRNSVPESGALVEFTVQLTNKSTADVITIEQLVDSIYGNVDATNGPVESTDCQLPLVLQPAGQAAAVHSCRFSAFVNGNIGEQHVNVITARGFDDDGKDVEDSDSATVTVVNENSKLAVTKESEVTQIAEPGRGVRFDITVQNRSSADSVNLQSIVDSVFGDVSVTSEDSSESTIEETTCEPPILLPIGGTYSCFFVAPVLGAAGHLHENTIVVIGEDDDGNKASAIDNAEIFIVDVPASLEVIKQADKTLIPESGDTVQFTVVARNTSAIDTVTLHTVTDSVFGNVGENCAPSLPAELAPGGEIVCTFSEIVFGDVGQPHVNTVLVEGFDDDNIAVSGQATSEIDFTDVPSVVEVRKSADRTTASRAGDPVRFTVRFSNQSATDVVTIQSIMDSAFGDVTDGSNKLLLRTDCTTPQTVAAGQLYECTFEAMVNGGLGDIHENIVTINGVDDDQQPVSGSDEVMILVADPVIRAVKGAELIDQNGEVAGPGSRIRYSVEIQNSGNATARGVSLTDIPDANTSLLNGSVSTTVGTVSGGNGAGDERVLVTLGELSPGARASVTFDVVVNDPLSDAVSKIANQALISGENFPVLFSENPLGPGPTVTLVRLVPVLEATKTAALSVDSNADGNYTPGDQILYEINIRNSGSAAATEIRVTDVIDSNATLINSSVNTSKGTITSGNALGESTVNVHIAALAPEEKATIRFVVRIKSPLPSTITQITNQASITAEDTSILTDDPDVDGFQDPTVVRLGGVAAIDASKAALMLIDQGEPGYSAGDTIIYQIMIRNSGNVATGGVKFSDTLDPNTSLLVGTVQSDQGTILEGNQKGDTAVAINVGQIPADGKVTVSFQARINSDVDPGLISVVNQGLVSGTGIGDKLTDDPHVEGKANPTESVLQPRAVLRLTMTDIFFIDADSDGIVSIGDTLLYQLHLTNIGKNSAHDVWVENTLDPNLVLIPQSVTTDRGVVQNSSTSASQNALVFIETLHAGEDVSLSFLARVISKPRNGFAQNQASARFRELGQVSAQQSILSDDPATTVINDATSTPIGQAPFGLIFMPVVH